MKDEKTPPAERAVDTQELSPGEKTILAQIRKRTAAKHSAKLELIKMRRDLYAAGASKESIAEVTAEIERVKLEGSSTTTPMSVCFQQWHPDGITTNAFETTPHRGLKNYIRGHVFNGAIRSTDSLKLGGSAGRARRSRSRSRPRRPRSATQRSSAASGDSGSDSDPDPEPAADVVERSCGCGCGELVVGFAPQAKYLNGTHQKRGKRQQDAEQRQRKDREDAERRRLAEDLNRKRIYLSSPRGNTKPESVRVPIPFGGCLHQAYDARSRDVTCPKCGHTIVDEREVPDWREHVAKLERKAVEIAQARSRPKPPTAEIVDLDRFRERHTRFVEAFSDAWTALKPLPQVELEAAA